MPIIRSISFNQDEILDNIATLYTGNIECDPTFGSGCFYKHREKPKFCSDLNPRQPGIVAADCRDLPLADKSIESVLFDPPFMARTGPGATLKARFGEIKGTIHDLWRLYDESLQELARILRPGGFLVMKCQDGVLSGENNCTYVQVVTMAARHGFKWMDVFVLCAKHRMMHPAHKIQRHARKFHSYFVVFRRLPCSRIFIKKT